MTEIVIIDTTVLLNLLNITGRNQQHEESMSEFRRLIDCKAEFLIPLAVVFEISNHIKRSDNGRRYECAVKLRDAVSQVMDQSRFWIGTIQFPDPDDFMAWIDEYPEYCAGAIDLNDLSIIKEWHRIRDISRNQRVRIWSYDSDLEGYDYPSQN